MNRDQFYLKLEQEFELIHNNYKYAKKFQTDEADIAQIARLSMFCWRVILAAGLAYGKMEQRMLLEIIVIKDMLRRRISI